jgi:thioredoxin reductase
MPKSDPRRVAILGAGPVGLEAALYARALGFPVAVYERGQVGDAVRRWGHVRLFTPFGANVTPLGRAALGKVALPADGDCVTGRDHIAAYLEPLSKCDALRDCIKAETNVVCVGRAALLKGDGEKRGLSPFRLLVNQANKERIDEADVVLDCTGTYGNHRWMGEGGIPAPGERQAAQQIAYGLDDILGRKQDSYAGKSVLLVGAGYSAATAACGLATVAETAHDTWVVWLARGPKTQPLPRVPGDPLKERDRLAVRANNLASRGDGNVEFHPSSFVQAVEWKGPDKGFRVTARCGGKERSWDVERIIANVGFSPDANIYRELQVQEDPATLGHARPATAEPNFFVLGAKSRGRDSNFFLKTGFEQVRDVFALITGNAHLDLYQSAK